MTDRIELTVKMQVTVPQALALKAMFLYWNKLSKQGKSEMVSFFVDGDGNFHPECTVCTSEDIPELTEEIKNSAIVETYVGPSTDFDYYPIAAILRNK